MIYEGKCTKCLIDTGSLVTTVNLDFYNSLTSKPPIRISNDFDLNVSAANGQEVPYVEYIEARISVLFHEENVFDLPALVVPNTTNNLDILVIH